MGDRHPRAVTRVVDAQRHAAWALLVTGCFAAAAVVAALTEHRTGNWLPLHLFVVGSLLCAISGVTQMLAITWSTAAAPVDGVAAIQLASVAAGASLVAVGRESDTWGLVALGAGLLAAALVLLGGILAWVLRWSATDRFVPAVRGYLVAVGWGIAGITLGALASRGGEMFTARVIEAHLVVNLLGLVGLVVLCTLPYFAATQLRMKMSAAATRGRLGAIPVAGSAAVAAVATGLLVGNRPLVAVGLGSYALVVCAVARMLPRPTRKQAGWAGARAVGLLGGLVWWVVCLGVLAARSLHGPVVGDNAVLALVVGAYGQILVASVAYLAPVVRAGGHIRLRSGFGVMMSWPGFVAANLAALALLVGMGRLALVVVSLWVVDTVVRGMILVSGSDDPEGHHRTADP